MTRNTAVFASMVAGMAGWCGGWYGCLRLQISRSDLADEAFGSKELSDEARLPQALLAPECSQLFAITSVIFRRDFHSTLPQ